MIAGCWPPMDHFDHSFPFEHLIPIFVTVCGPGQAGDRWRAANYQFRLHGSDIYSFYSLTKSPFVTRTWEDSPVLTTSPLSGSQQFPHYGPLTGPALDLWISGVTNEVKLSCDVWWCRGRGVISDHSWRARWAPPPPAFLTAAVCLNCRAFIRLLSLLLLFVMTFNNGKFLPLINLLILVYWNAIFTNGKVLLLHNHFNPSLSQKTFMMGNFQIS